MTCARVSLLVDMQTTTPCDVMFYLKEWDQIYLTTYTVDGLIAKQIYVNIGNLDNF